jgi:hypothetical protein
LRLRRSEQAQNRGLIALAGFDARKVLGIENTLDASLPCVSMKAIYVCKPSGPRG